MEIKEELLKYDIFPKVIPENKEVEICIQPLGRQSYFDEKEYTLSIRPVHEGEKKYYHLRQNELYANAIRGDDECLRFSFTFEKEQEYFIRAYNKSNKRFLQLSVYCVAEDLVGKYPFIGDLHFHTTGSDGRQCPEIACANGRKHGYDFMAITDHERYFPSLEAINFYKNIPIDLNIVPGEEIHLPKINPEHTNDVHIVNFGGEYSINALFEGEQLKTVGEDKAKRSLNGKCPETRSTKEMNELFDSINESNNIPEGIEKYTYTSCKWIFDEIRKAGGLGIFCHPYWISDVYQVPETFTEYLMETQPFDAFEVLGGERYFEQNGFQTIRYYEDLAKGRKYPIVGSSDCHNSDVDESFIARTIVFSPENERKALISSIKDFKSVAVDTISKEYRLVGELRLVRYACFLMKNYFPIHDELCFEEGRAMRSFASGNKEEENTIKFFHGRTKRLLEKYFLF